MNDITDAQLAQFCEWWGKQLHIDAHKDPDKIRVPYDITRDIAYAAFCAGVREGQKQQELPTKGPAHPKNCLCGFVGTTQNIRAHRQQCEIWQSQFGWPDKNQNEGS